MNTNDLVITPASDRGGRVQEEYPKDLPDPERTFQTLHSLTDEQWHELLLKENRSDFRGVPIPKLPSENVQRRSSGSLGAEANLGPAFRFYSLIKAAIARYGLPLTHDSYVLDFGCGWGRVTRYFLKDVPSTNLYGVDVDPITIDACQRTIGHGRFATIEASPPTALPSNTFDLIYGYSVFSHLPEDLHLRWLDEFTRILKPGGLLVQTTLSRAFVEDCQRLRQKATFEHAWQRAAAESFPDPVEALSMYDRGEFLYAPYPTPIYGMAVIPRKYIEKKWRSVELLDYTYDPSVLAQALIIARKPAFVGKPQRPSSSQD
jgi:SAM-dependent methyltransferase